MKLKKQNLAFYILLIAFFLVIQGPNLWNNFKMQGESIEKMEAILIKNNQAISFPANDNSVVLFWATWCAPCKLEMNRLQNAIDAGDISPLKVWAYNPFEDVETSKKFIAKSNYKFQFIATNPDIGKALNIKATPTYLWLQGNQVYRMTTGISIINLYWLEYFLM